MITIVLRLIALGTTLLLIGCATPAPVKEALVSVDQAYKDNANLIDQYRNLVSQTNERHAKWYRIVNNRALLGLALAWATTDPAAIDKDPQKRASRVDAIRDVLGTQLVNLVNEVRLKNLPAQSGTKEPVFGTGTGTTDELILAIPKIVDAIDKRTTEQYAVVKNNLGGFADYKTNLGVLMRINSTIEQYLDIDITVKSDDVNEIAKAIKQLR